ncbi:heme ABC transporter ATP-binding protein [Motilimonas pumila]|uniref:Heme ABC transporter ATP-binding protein n=1 Tax=Motilimonas pumila TaxID=2303987 RepID=A0A418YEB1_9GAMM|nr:heme ABC transporter ATP-binding protein [Motilimonas pumila]RJG47491.1 heme ABC transporter ATP-binding protein [Motilimonas pumila]
MLQSWYQKWLGKTPATHNDNLITNINSTSELALEVRNLSFSIAEKDLVQQANLTVKQGQFTALLGPNGAGKSSLLKLICGDLTSAQSSQKVKIFGHSRQQWPARELAQHLAVLPQHSQLSFAFSVTEVVSLGALSLALPQNALLQLVHQSMQQTGVAHLAERAYPTLSGGEKQRVHLARVLTQLAHAGRQGLLLLDEPTSALDLAQQHKVLRLCRKLAQQGVAIVVVLHDLNLAAQYSDQIVLMNNGKIVASGTPTEVMTADTVSATYGWPVKVVPHPELSHPVVMS